MCGIIVACSRLDISIIIMENKSLNLPLYLKIAQIITGIAIFFYILYIGQDIIIPLVFAVIIAILLNPVVNYLYNKKVNRVVAIFIAVLTAFIALAALFYFIGSQVALFSESFPKFKQQFLIILNDVIQWVAKTFKISNEKITEGINKIKSEGMTYGTSLIGQTIGTISGVLIIIFLMPVYIFFFLFYKPLLLDFIAQLFARREHALVAEVLVETKTLVQSYLMGLLIEAALVATLNSLGLIIIGINYAILLGVIGAILNIIPYIGGIIAVALPMLIAVATKSPISAIWVLVAHLLVQFIDNNFFVPSIVASKVKLNALISIVVVFIGGALWGVAGMFLSIPLTAIIKVIFDRIAPLKPFGFLLGDNQPAIGKVILKRVKRNVAKQS